VTEIVEVLERQQSGPVVVQHDVGVALDLLVSGDGDDGRAHLLVQRGIDEQEAVHGALGEQAGVLVDEVLLALVADDIMKVAGLEEVLFNAVHQHGEVAFAELRHDHADRKGLAGAQGTGDGIGAVVQPLGGFEDALACGGGDG
jgi:hypothetical protein